LRFSREQLHNPYLATPLSIASIVWPPRRRTKIIGISLRGWIVYKPVFVLQAWAGERAFKLESRTKDRDYSDPESAMDDKMNTTVKPMIPSWKETIWSLPDAAVPLGLIADLSLSNTKAKLAATMGTLLRRTRWTMIMWYVGTSVSNGFHLYFKPIYFRRVSRTRHISCQDLPPISVFAPCSSSNTVRQRFLYMAWSHPKMWTSCSTCKFLPFLFPIHNFEYLQFLPTHQREFYPRPWPYNMAHIIFCRLSSLCSIPSFILLHRLSQDVRSCSPSVSNLQLTFSSSELMPLRHSLCYIIAILFRKVGDIPDRYALCQTFRCQCLD
jgi:hypothetical protein